MVLVSTLCAMVLKWVSTCTVPKEVYGGMDKSLAENAITCDGITAGNLASLQGNTIPVVKVGVFVTKKHATSMDRNAITA
jgi:hypothetical protein